MNGQKVAAITRANIKNTPIFKGTNFNIEYTAKKYHSGLMCAGVILGLAGSPNPGGSTIVKALIKVIKKRATIIVW